MKPATVLLAAVLCAAAGAAPPRVFFSDLESGPKTGGQNGKGAFVTIRGSAFGATRGSSYVTVGSGQADNYPIWSDTKITFQLGANPTTGNITVTTGSGTSNGVPFTVRAGNIYFVSLTGSDTNDGSFATPWRTIVQAKDGVGPGDIAYIMDGVSQTTINDYAAALSISSAGTSGNPKALVAYPGANVTIGWSTVTYAVRTPAISGGPFSYWVFSGLNIRGETGMDLVDVSNWRVVNNDFSCPNGAGQSACLHTDTTTFSKFFGNYDHGSGSSPTDKYYHRFYFTTNTNNVEVAWNEITGGYANRAIQFYSTGGFDQYGLSVHDNYIHDIIGDGINFATVVAGSGTVEAYNNVVARVGKGPDPSNGATNYACMLIAGTDTGTVQVYNNTFYDCGSNGGNDAGLMAVEVHTSLRNNIFYAVGSEPYITPTSAPSIGMVSGSNNVWYGAGAGPSQTTGNINSNPNFVSAAGSDFHLQTGSPAINAGVTLSLATDKDGILRPQGSAFDVGAYEFVSGGTSISGSGGVAGRASFSGAGTVTGPSSPIPLSARVVGAAPTQAILAVVCGLVPMIEVSESPTYSPLVADVDPALFSNSNRGDRPENVALAGEHLFVVGKRAAEKSAGVYRSRALKANTLHYYRATCGTDQVTGTFRTANVMPGSWADPVPADPADASGMAWPAPPAARGSSVVDPQTGVEIAAAALPGDTTATTWAYLSDGGFGQYCHPTPVTASDGKVGFHCVINLTSAAGLYWIERGGGEVRFLGQLMTNATADYNKQYVSHPLALAFSATNPNVIYTKVTGAVAGKFYALKGTYTHTAGQDGDRTGITDYQTLPLTTWTMVTPADRDLLTLLREFRAQQDTAWSDYEGSGTWTGGAGSLAVDASTPAAVKSNDQVLTTASFTPPAGSMLYVLISINTNTGDPNKITSVTDNLVAHLTYTKVASYGTELSGDTVVYLYTAPVSTSQAMTVSATQQATGLSRYAMLRVLVVTGADAASPVGAYGGARGHADNISGTDAQYLSTAANSWGWLVYGDWSQGAIPTAGVGQTVDSSYTVAGEDTYAVIKQNAATPTVGTTVTMSTTAPASGLQASYLWFEMKPAAGAGGTMLYLLQAGAQNGHLLLYVWPGQNKMGWSFIFDPEKISTAPGCVAHDAGHPNEKGCVIAATGSYTGGAAAANRWAVMHQQYNWWNAAYASLEVNTLSGSVPYMGPYYFNVTAVDGTAGAGLPASGGACPGRPAGSPIPVSEWPTTGCTKITVDGEPRSSQAPTSVGPALAGDRVLTRVPTGYADGGRDAELLRLLWKETASDWWVQRGYGDPAYYYARVKAAPLTFGMFPTSRCVESGGYTGNVWWDYQTDPFGLALMREKNCAVIGAHTTALANAYYAAYVMAGYVVRLGTIADIIPASATWPYFSVPAPPFAGLNPSNAAADESHPSLSASNAPARESHWAVDGGPYLGDAATVQAGNVTLVSGSLYKITGSAVADLVANLKRGPLAVTTGRRPLLDVSGPASSISDAAGDNHKYCVALNAGECRAGSAVGDLYANIPAPTYAYCYDMFGKSTLPTDLCVARPSARTQTLHQVSFTEKEYRALGHALTAYKGPSAARIDKNQYWNARALPDGSAVLANVGTNDVVGLLRVPPYPNRDSINRRTFIPVSVEVGAVSGADNAVVEFGYGPDLRCASRQEACVAAGTGQVNEANPFYWASESYAGVPCAAGCSVTVSALPQRALYYRVKRRSGATVKATGQVQVVAVP